MLEKLSKPAHRLLFGPPRLVLYILIAIYFLLGSSTAVYLYYNNPSTVEKAVRLYDFSSNKTATGSSSPNADTSNEQGGNESTPNESAKKSSPSGGTSPASSNPGSSNPSTESLSATVAFYSDSQSDTDAEDQNHQRVVNYILGTSANPVFHAGDLMEDGTQDSLNRFNSVTSTLRSTRTFYAALGNNDRKLGDPTTPSQLFLDNFTFPNNEQWYSVNIGNLHMVVLDSAFSASNQNQINWLVADLQSSASQSRITGVMYHHPSFSSTVGSYFRDYGVDFVVAGHLHSYSHSVTDGIHYFVMTGQPSIGYCIAKIYTNHIEFTAYNSSNSVIETASFNKR